MNWGKKAALGNTGKYTQRQGSDVKQQYWANKVWASRRMKTRNHEKNSRSQTIVQTRLMWQRWWKMLFRRCGGGLLSVELQTEDFVYENLNRRWSTPGAQHKLVRNSNSSNTTRSRTYSRSGFRTLAADKCGARCGRVVGRTAYVNIHARTFWTQQALLVVSSCSLKTHRIQLFLFLSCCKSANWWAAFSSISGPTSKSEGRWNFFSTNWLMTERPTRWFGKIQLKCV